MEDQHNLDENPNENNNTTDTPTSPALTHDNSSDALSNNESMINDDFVEPVIDSTELVPFSHKEDSDSAELEDYFNSFPPGYRFKPFDEELVVFYLHKKIHKQILPPNRIKEVNLYRHNPEDLAAEYPPNGENEWYFFTPRDRKYPNGDRPNRAAGDGYWKATGADKPVTFCGQKVGFRKALVFYKGRPPRGDKTEWIMHEYRVNDPPKKKRPGNDMKLDDWVLCRIYKKLDRSFKASSHLRDQSIKLQQQHQFENGNPYKSLPGGSKETLVPSMPSGGPLIVTGGIYDNVFDRNQGAAFPYYYDPSPYVNGGLESLDISLDHSATYFGYDNSDPSSEYAFPFAFHSKPEDEGFTNFDRFTYNSVGDDETDEK